MPGVFRTFACVATSWDLLYSVSHKVEISERFKNHRLEFEGQSANLKHAEKIDERKVNAENVVIEMSTLMLNCTFFGVFRTFAYFNFMGQTIYAEKIDE